MGHIEYKKYNIHAELVDFSQAQFEKYQTAVITASRQNYYDYGSGRGITAEAVVTGATIRAAHEIGILSGLTKEQIENLTPKVAAWLVEKIRKHVKDVVTPDSDPN